VIDLPKQTAPKRGPSRPDVQDDLDDIFPVSAIPKELSDWDERVKPIDDALLVPVDLLRANSEQPRQYFDPKEMDTLKNSIKEMRKLGRGIGGTGILQALLARRDSGAVTPTGKMRKGARLMIIAGERRWRVAQELGLESVPVIITDASSESAYEQALMENLMRHDMSPLEEGVAIRCLMNQKGMGIIRIAKFLGMDKGQVQNRLDVLKMTGEEQELITRNPETMSSLIQISRQRKNPELHRELMKMLKNGATHAEITRKIKVSNGRNNAASIEVESIDGAMAKLPLTNGSHADGDSNDNGYYGHGPSPNTVPRINYFEHLESIARQLANVDDAIGSVPPTPTMRKGRVMPALEQIRQWCDSIEKKSATVHERRAKGKP
jgi:ParB family chromosome partitioning protein